MFVNPNLIHFDTFVFCSIPRLLVCLHMRMSTSKQYAKVYVKSIWSVRGPLRECRSIRSGASGLPYYCAPPVCVSDVIELLAVWCHNNTKNQKIKELVRETEEGLGSEHSWNTKSSWTNYRLYSASTRPANESFLKRLWRGEERVWTRVSKEPG